MSFYRDTYLKSDHWKNLRLRRLARSKGKCDLCGEEGGIGLDVHHLDYHDLYDVKCKELRALCRPCHDAVHAVMKAFPNLITVRNPGKRWGKIALAAKRWRRYSKRYGEEFAKAAIVIRQGFWESYRRREKVNQCLKLERWWKWKVKHIVCWYGGWPDSHHGKRVLSKIECD